MRIHTNKLRASHVRDAINAEIKAGRVAPSVRYKVLMEHTSRSHETGIELQLESWEKLPGDGRRYGNSGSYGAGTDYTATYDEWGFILQAIFELDPEAIVGSVAYPIYEGKQGFEYQTGMTYNIPEMLRDLAEDGDGDYYPYRSGRNVVGRRGAGRVSDNESSRVLQYATYDPRNLEDYKKFAKVSLTTVN